MSTSETFTPVATAITDIGRIRRQNEDRFLKRDDLLLFAVADGIGGLPGGALAAQTTVNLLAEQVDTAALKSPADLVAPIHRVNKAVMMLGLRLSPTTGIGTTLTCGHLRGNQLWWAHVGDSRCYHFRGDKFVCLTTDHSVANDNARRRHAGEDVPEIEDPRVLGALTRCIGQPDAPRVDCGAVNLEPGDRLLFATDGVTRMISDRELNELTGGEEDPATRLANLVAIANQRGGPDNATAVLIEIPAHSLS